MNLFQYSKVVYRGRIDIDFYLFCLKKDWKLIRFLFFNFIYLVISSLFKKYEDLYQIKKYKYIKYINNLDNAIVDFYKEKNRINNIKINKQDIIVDKIPNVLIDKKICKKNIGYEFDENYNVDIEKFNCEVNKIKKSNKIFIRNMNELSNIDASEYVIVNNKRQKSFNKRKKTNQIFINLIYIVVISILLTCMSFFYTFPKLNIDVLTSYFSPKLFILNFLPVLFFMTLLLLIFKKVHISAIISSFLILGFGIANQTKLLYRDDIVKFIDLTLLKEAATMAERYEIVIKSYTIIFILLLVVVCVFAKNKSKKIEIKPLIQFLLIIVMMMLGLFGYKTIYRNEEMYNNLGDKTLINVWIETRQYQIRGLVYPFVYTIADGFDVEPKGYDEQASKKNIEKYRYENIKESQKVNVIAIMLEAYNDFSKFKEIEFIEDVYENFHEIQKKSISGSLITSVFGGGTIVTERNFLTGYLNEPNYRKKTNSYVWYFKEQGYKTEAMHPVFGAFYNRASANPNLGFDKYYHYDNTFSDIKSDYLDDDAFFDYIISGYEKAKKENVPYFNFSVTYQNHGPYPDTKSEKEYFKNNNYNIEAYNTLNWYFDGISRTDVALGNLIDYFENESEPTIVIFFGDHNPYLGENGLAYNELGINLDLSTEEGFRNYYETPYVIYANKKAKKIYDKSFIGKGNTISPIFLMNELFDYCGLKGNEYLQYMSDLKQNVDVISNVFNKENNKFIFVGESNFKEKLEEYEFVNYYYSRNYIDRSK